MQDEGHFTTTLDPDSISGAPAALAQEGSTELTSLPSSSSSKPTSPSPTRRAKNTKSGFPPVTDPQGAMQHRGLYDDEFGFPCPKNYSSSKEFLSHKIEYDPFFGPPVRADSRNTRPTGQPKPVASAPKSNNPPPQPQRQMQQQQSRPAGMQSMMPQNFMPQQPPSAAPAPGVAAAPVGGVTHEPMVSPNTEQRQSVVGAVPDQQTLFAWAQYIGINPKEEPHLLPVAQKTLATPAPKPWTAVKDPQSGRTFYGNEETRDRSWDHPLLSQFRQQVVEAREQWKKEQEKNNATQQQQQQQQSVAPAPAAAASPAPTTTSAPAPASPPAADQQTLFAWAAYIGVDPKTETNLLPLAQETLATPPPKPWTAVKDPQSGRTFYGNEETRDRSWDHPLLSQFRQRVIEAREQSKQQQQQQQQQPNQQPNQQPQLPQMTPQQQQTLFAWAQYIGINPIEEPQLLPLAQETLSTPPPKPWTAVKDPQSGRTFYGNEETRDRSWDHPLLSQFRQQVMEARSNRMSPPAAAGGGGRAAHDQGEAPATNPLRHQPPQQMDAGMPAGDSDMPHRQCSPTKANQAMSHDT